MARALLLVLLPIVLPLLLYFAYIKFIKRPVPAGDAGEADEQERARQRTLFWISLGMVVVAAAAFATLRFSGTVAPGTVLEAPRLIDGKVVPSHPVE